MDLILASFDREFSVIDRHSRELLSKLDDHQLFQRPSGTAVSTAPFSCGACILRSAATIERTFGGLMTRLWDDPFEWTLPEKLSDKAAVLNYLDEVEATRSKGFGFFTSDAESHTLRTFKGEHSPSFKC
jgi:hypothetical protein